TKNMALPQKRLPLDGTFLLILCLFAPVAGCSSERSEKSRMIDSTTAPFDMMVSSDDVAKRESMAIVPKVTNNSDRVLGWDKDFSVFLAWCLVANHDEHQLVPKIDVNVVEQTPETLGKNRFMVIEPRESVSSKIILTMPFRAFSYDVATLYLEGRRV